MQELLQTQKINDDLKKQIILESISDKYCRQILKNTIEKPKSAMMISDEANIPLSTVYRKLERLCEGKLLTISGSINRDGKKYFLYMSRIKEVTIHHNSEKTTIECILNDTKQKDIT